MILETARLTRFCACVAIERIYLPLPDHCNECMNDEYGVNRLALRGKDVFEQAEMEVAGANGANRVSTA